MTHRTSLFPTGFSASAVRASRLGLLPLLPVLFGHCQAVALGGPFLSASLASREGYHRQIVLLLPMLPGKGCQFAQQELDEGGTA